MGGCSISLHGVSSAVGPSHLEFSRFGCSLPLRNSLRFWSGDEALEAARAPQDRYVTSLASMLRAASLPGRSSSCSSSLATSPEHELQPASRSHTLPEEHVDGR